MRPLSELAKYCVASGYDGGEYAIECEGIKLCVIASMGGGWDHISVSTKDRCPTWDEMEFIARLFFNPDEVAMQLHLPVADHINMHPFVLHWWRPQKKLRRIPLPPKKFV